jgi:glycosyltransferase involved in cell wall biosynthesis
LAERGHEIHVVTLHPPQDVEGVHLYHLAAPITRYTDAAFFFNYWRIKMLLQKINPEVVGGLGLSNYGFYAAFCGKHPLVVGAYGSDVLRAPKESRRLKWMVQYAISKADLVTADAEILRRAIIELGGKEEKVIVFPLGVDETLLSVGSERDFSPKEEFIILSYRSLEPLYNIELILRSFPIVLGQVEKAKLIIAGDGSQRGKLENLASQIGIREQTQFIGAVPHEKVPDLLASADVYLSASLSDSTSVSLLEAMAAGAYPIVSDIPGNREWIKDGVNGSVVPIGDPLTLADKIVQALRSDELRKTAAKNNLELITKRALWDDNISFLEAALKRLANG